MRADLDTEDNSLDEDFYDRHGADIDYHERLLDQMLARRRKAESDRALVKNNSGAGEDIYADKVFLKELMIEIANKRRRTDDVSPQ